MKFLLAALCLILVGCNTITRKQVDAAIWLNNAPIPADICEREPQLKQYGFYRKLDNGKIEFLSFCKPSAGQWVAVYGPQFYKFLDALLPP